MSKLIELAFSSFVLSFEVLVRKNFGERYLNYSRVVIAIGWYLVFFVVTAIVGQVLSMFANPFSLVSGTSASVAKSPSLVSPAFFIFFVCVVIFLFVELSKVVARNKRGEQWHSWNSGVERDWIVRVGKMTGIYQLCDRMFGKYVINRFITQLYVEPVIFLVAGVVLLFVPTALSLGLWLILGAALLTTKSHGLYDRFRDQYLDAIDSQIEAQHFTDALIDRKAPEETAGFTPMSLSHPITEDQKKSVAESMRAFEENNPNLASHMKSKYSMPPTYTPGK